MQYFLLEYRAVYEIMWKNIVERGRPQITTWHMLIACWITEATNTHSQYVILIAFPLQQWLHERASILRFTYSVSLSCSYWRWLFFTSWGGILQPVSPEDNSSQNSVFNCDLHCGMRQPSGTMLQTHHLCRICL
jgi:hypothetical protein